MNSDTVTLELVRMIGESFRSLTQKIESIERNGINSEELVDLKNKLGELQKVIEKSMTEQQALCQGCLLYQSVKKFNEENAGKIDTIAETIVKWADFWGGLIKVRTISILVAGVLFALVGFGTVIYKAVVWVGDNVHVKHTEIIQTNVVSKPITLYTK